MIELRTATRFLAVRSVGRFDNKKMRIAARQTLISLNGRFPPRTMRRIEYCQQAIGVLQILLWRSHPKSIFCFGCANLAQIVQAADQQRGARERILGALALLLGEEPPSSNIWKAGGSLRKYLEFPYRREENAAVQTTTAFSGTYRSKISISRAAYPSLTPARDHKRPFFYAVRYVVRFGSFWTEARPVACPAMSALLRTRN